MLVVDNDNIAFVDVDGTLVFFEPKTGQEPTITVDVGGATSILFVNQAILQEIHNHKKRGQKVFVWSQGGYTWALAVVKALRLERVVDVVMSKPKWVWDDLQPDKWMPEAWWKN